MAFTYSRKIRVNHNSCGSANSTNFPLLFSGTYPFLKQTANGGGVTNASGFDIGFYSDAALTTKLNWEMESYTGSTGSVTYWIQIPTLTFAADTIFYIAWGDPTITTDQSNVSGGVSGWLGDTSWKGVWHLQQSGVNYLDSSSNANHWTTAVTPTAQHLGQVLTGQSFDGSSQFLGTAANFVGKPTIFTVSHWINPATGQTSRTIFSNYNPAASTSWVTGISDSTSNVVKFYLGSANLESDVALVSATWSYVVCVYNSGSPTIYINGIAHGTSGSTITYPAGAITDANRLARLGVSGAQWFNGGVDELRYSTSARSASWVLSEYNNQVKPDSFYSIDQQVSLNNYQSVKVGNGMSTGERIR